MRVVLASLFGGPLHITALTVLTNVPLANAKDFSSDGSAGTQGDIFCRHMQLHLPKFTNSHPYQKNELHPDRPSTVGTAV